ncbi:putative UDP-N-acetylmuramate dehydrogenase [Aspergillus novofumigatus IBT 16806]|uniref:UDP-N-acetylmuramate dehydrogenase n=1 Tax=Aspergillus novofumigatus (strain IBT 16806) TaxID=1392255 RepID=A0A2I1CMC0_ASPN1|nr:udp-n-acetylenolpyruvoylglucosamine reductase [Aspergillus novofumigatus IBT 16806]PKX98777.1 udp-n-acetylenolpyruvoylglucosamine reductase [Aspergillus novofumigatus IBT 16806]
MVLPTGTSPRPFRHNGQMEEYVDLLPYNTFHIASTARYFVRVQHPDQLEALVHSPIFQTRPHFVLGGGSNILFANDTYEGIVLKNETSGIEIVYQDEEHTTLRVGGGVAWAALVSYCLDHDLGGLENLALIPGTVGAAPIQNIGAYGVELSDVLESLCAIDLITGARRQMSNAECQFSYRDSVFKHTLQYVFIASVTLRLTNPGNHRLNTTYGPIRRILENRGVQVPTIQSVAEAVCLLRRSKLPDPELLGNAGSFFKNAVVDQLAYDALQAVHPTIPVFLRANGSKVIPAAWLIERCGWKGKRIGRVGVYDQHALVLVNYGSANGFDVLEFASRIREDVMGRFGIWLEFEVRIVT